jgi:hypothetical protein
MHSTEKSDHNRGQKPDLKSQGGGGDGAVEESWSLNFTDEERKKVSRQARKVGLQPGEYIRRRTLGENVVGNAQEEMQQEERQQEERQRLQGQESKPSGVERPIRRDEEESPSVESVVEQVKNKIGGRQDKSL